MQWANRALSAVRMSTQRERQRALDRLGECFRLMREEDRKLSVSSAQRGVDIGCKSRSSGREVRDSGDPDAVDRCAFIDEQTYPAAAQAIDHFERLAVHLVIAEDRQERHARIEHARRGQKLSGEDRIVVDVVAGEKDDIRLLRGGLPFLAGRA